MNAMTFPFEALRQATTQVSPDKGAVLAARLGITLARLVPTAAVAAVATPSGDRVAVAMQRSDGLRCAIDIAPQLAEALVSLSLGGSFSIEPTRTDTLTPSERRAQHTLITACLDAVDAVWPSDEARWQTAAAPVTGTAHSYAVNAGDFSASITLVIAAFDAAEVTQAAGSPRADIAWSRGMRALLGATGLPLRAVLYERQLPLAQAVQLAPGDVLPIEAPRDVQLRIGTHPIARGTVAPLGDDGALLVTITSRRPDPAMRVSLEEQS